MKTIAKFGLITALLLTLSYCLSFVPLLKIYFDRSIIGAIRFVVLGGVMFYAVNDYLKHHNSSGNYNYLYGLIICFGSGILGLLLSSLIITMISFGEYNLIVNFPRIISNLIINFPLLLIFSIIIPLTFRNKPKKGIKSDAEDILDADIN